jgi:hypothetical protein
MIQSEAGIALSQVVLRAVARRKSETCFKSLWKSLTSSSPVLLPPQWYSPYPVLESSYHNASKSVIVFATRVPADYRVLTPGRKSAWGMLSLGRTDVGEQKTGYASTSAAGIQKFSSQSAA